jgi:hypothetical protein
LGVSFPRPLENPAGKLFHARSEAEGGAHLGLDCPSFVPVWNADWAQRTDLIGRIVLGFRLATFRRKIAAGGADVGIAAFAENCKVGRI